MAMLPYYNGEGTYAIEANEGETEIAVTVPDANGNWYYVVGSKAQSDFTGVANYKNAYGWWYVKNGKVDFTYAGFAKNKNGTWKVKGGKVQF